MFCMNTFDQHFDLLKPVMPEWALAESLDMTEPEMSLWQKLRSGLISTRLFTRG